MPHKESLSRSKVTSLFDRFAQRSQCIKCGLIYDWLKLHILPINTLIKAACTCYLCLQYNTSHLVFKLSQRKESYA